MMHQNPFSGSWHKLPHEALKINFYGVVIRALEIFVIDVRLYCKIVLVVVVFRYV
jgi:hypothetical protein